MVINASNLHMIKTAHTIILMNNHDDCQMAQMAQIGNNKQDFEEVSDLRGGKHSGLFQAQPTEEMFGFMMLLMQIWERKELFFD